MTSEKQRQIANSFSAKFQEFDLNISLSQDEFVLFDIGVVAKNMDEKWNIFVLDHFMFWARSWTSHCIYKIQLTRHTGFVMLEKGFVTREKTQYNSNNIKKDKILFLQLLQAYLNRDDLYIDPEFEFKIIKEIISKHDPHNKCIKSIGHGNDVGVTKSIYDGLITNSKDFCDVLGWRELRKNIDTKNDKEELLSLYFQNKETREATTFYFDKDAKQLLGQVTIIKTISSS